jgi:RimJ/RimL family protein N-acetyltransferase
VSQSAQIIATDRLDLIAMTPELAQLEARSTDALASALDVPVPATWPPDLYESDDLERLSRVLGEPGTAGWALYYVVRREPRTLIGVSGFGGPPGDSGTVEVGYSVLQPFRRRGFASEAVGGLLDKAFSDPRVDRVIAETYHSLAASMAVLVKSGFALTHTDPVDNKLRYELTRASFIQDDDGPPDASGVPTRHPRA